MKAVQLYYAAFSAALMAKAEPVLAQQLAYKFTYLAQHPELFSYPPSAGREVVDGRIIDESPSSPPPIPQRRPINPLNHVDWLGGGRLNERWLKQQHFTPPRPKPMPLPTAALSITSESITSEPSPVTAFYGEAAMLTSARIFSKINDAILRALVRSDPHAQSKFAVGLFACLCHHGWPDITADRENYWLMMHAVRCYLYGTRLQWGPEYATNTEARQSRNPMYRIVAEFLAARHLHDPYAAQKQVMLQLSLLPTILQAQCLELGIAYRAEYGENEYSPEAGPHQHDTHPGIQDDPSLHAAIQWFFSD